MRGQVLDPRYRRVVAVHILYEEPDQDSNQIIPGDHTANDVEPGLDASLFQPLDASLLKPLDNLGL